MKISRKQLKKIIDTNLNLSNLNESYLPAAGLMGRLLYSLIKKVGWAGDIVAITQFLSSNPIDSLVRDVLSEKFKLDTGVVEHVITALKPEDKTWIVLLHPSTYTKKVDSDKWIKQKIVEIFKDLKSNKALPASPNPVPLTRSLQLMQKLNKTKGFRLSDRSYEKVVKYLNTL